MLVCFEATKFKSETVCILTKFVFRSYPLALSTGQSKSLQPSMSFSEPRPNPPVVFDGDSSQCHSFLTQCEIQFELQPSAFPSECSKVAYAVSLLFACAKLWGTSQWQGDSLLCYNYKNFAHELMIVFSSILSQKEASRGLLKLIQGNHRVTDLIIDFHTLAANYKWNEEALKDIFWQALSEDIKD